MEVLALLLVLGSNLCVLALGWAIYAGNGISPLCQVPQGMPVLDSPESLSSLGVGISGDLRLLPAGSGTALFNLWTLVSGALLLGLIILRGRLPRTRLRSPLPRVLLLLAGFVALNLVPLYLRLAIPDMRDVGSWGYDQRNYVFTTAGLLDEGLLPRMPHSNTPMGSLRSLLGISGG